MKIYGGFNQTRIKKLRIFLFIFYLLECMQKKKKNKRELIKMIRDKALGLHDFKIQHMLSWQA